MHPRGLHLAELHRSPRFVRANLHSERAIASYTDRLPSCPPAKNLLRRFPVTGKELWQAGACSILLFIILHTDVNHLRKNNKKGVDKRFNFCYSACQSVGNYD